jgi:hypothetical protein
VELEFYLWKRTWCASGVPHHLCDEFAFDWAYVEVQQPKRRGSQVVHSFILYYIISAQRCEFGQGPMRPINEIWNVESKWWKWAMPLHEIVVEDTYKRSVKKSGINLNCRARNRCLAALLK